MSNQTETENEKRPRHRNSMEVRPRYDVTQGRKIKRLVCFVEVRDRVLEGRPLAEIARFIQHDRHELEHLRKNTVINLLRLYKKNVPPAEVLARKSPQIVLEAQDKLDAGLDELMEMENLFRLQKARVDIAHEGEKRERKLDPELKHELRLAREVLQSSMEIKEQLGLVAGKKGKDQPQVIQVNNQMNQVNQVAAQYRERAESVRTVMDDPEKKRKVTAFLKGLLASTAEKGPIVVEAPPKESE